MEELMVNLGERSYPIHFGGDLTRDLRSVADDLTKAHRWIAVLTDQNLEKSQAQALSAMFGTAPRFVSPAGESTKSVAEFGRLLEFLAVHRLDRTSVLFAVGGGVIGDLGGFAAASYLRGIDYIQVPTTLLAMVDSSVGGKTGINLAAGKNLAGAFHQPRAVFIATGLLATLPPREFAAGTAEVIKTGLLGDAELFAELERAPLTATSPMLASVIRRCCALKARVVAADERELAKDGGRALLNLGHTFGHAIERVAGYGTYLHGEAVAIGLVAAGHLSHKLGLLSAADAARIETVVAAHQLPTRLRAPLPIVELAAAMWQDKKVRGRKLRFIVLQAIGTAATEDGVTAALVKASLSELGAA
jgi:3-dehydroquinate synthase